MKVFKCDRCLTCYPDEITPFVRLKIESDFHGIYDDFELCENCYQTIKEVLEDGEIK